MKLFIMDVKLGVMAHDASEAEEEIREELNYLIGLDNRMMSHEYVPGTAEELEGE